MAKIKEKEYDILLNLADMNSGDDNVSAIDLVEMGFNLDNTSIQDEDTYRNSEAVKRRFTVNGEFQEDTFKKFYEYAKYSYDQLGDLQTIKNNQSLIADKDGTNTTWQKILDKQAENTVRIEPDCFYFSSKNPKRTRIGFQIGLNANPDEVDFGFTVGGLRSEKVYSDAELAKHNQMQDYETGELLGTPEDSWWSNVFSLDTKVLATYDEDGYDEEGNFHRKGDAKLNADGHRYYETLGNRSVYGKEVLDHWNTLTNEGTWLKQFDFFDSDDLHSKHPVGVIMKTAAGIAPLFMRYVGTGILVTGLALNASSMLGTFIKMLPGVPQDNKILNNLEAWSKQFNYWENSTEEAKHDSLLNFENLMNMGGAVCNQLKQQRVLFEAPSWFNKNIKNTLAYQKAGTIEEQQKIIQKMIDANFKDKINQRFGTTLNNLLRNPNINPTEFKEFLQKDVARYSKNLVQGLMNDSMNTMKSISSPISKMYMVGLTTQETYGDLIERGADPEDAAVITLIHMIGEYGILKSDIGDHFFPELKHDRFKMKNMVNYLLKGEKGSSFSESLSSLNKTGLTNPTKFMQSAKSLYNKASKYPWIKRLADGDFADYMGSGISNVAMHGIAEGLEEVSEEIWADMAKSCTNLYRRARGKSDIETGAWEDWAQRYIGSFIGGVMGGAGAALSTNFGNMAENAKVDSSNINNMILSIATDKEQKDLFLKTLDSMTIGSLTHSFDWDDTEKSYKMTNDPSESQDAIMKQALKSLISNTEKILESEGADLDPRSVLNALTLEERKGWIKDINLSALENTRTLTYYVERFRNLQNELIALRSAKDAIQPQSDSNHTLTPEQQKQIDAIDARLGIVLDAIKEYKEGKVTPQATEVALFEANSQLHDGFMKALNLGMFAESYFGKSWQNLSDQEQNLARQKYAEYSESVDADYIFNAYQSFKRILNNSIPSLNEQFNYMQTLESQSLQHVKDLMQALSQVSEVEEDSFTAYADDVNQILTGANLPVTYSQDQLDELSLLQEIWDHVELDPMTMQDIINLNNYSNPILNGYLGPSGGLANTISVDYVDPNTGVSPFLEYLKSNFSVLQNADLSNDYLFSENIITKAKDSIKYNVFKNSLQTALNSITSSQYLNPLVKQYLRAQIKNLNLPEDVKDQLIDDLEQLNLPQTPVLELLTQFIDSTGQTSQDNQSIINILGELKKQIQFGGKFDFSQLTLSDADKNNLTTLLTQINALKNVIQALRKDNADIKNIKGYAPLINNLNAALGTLNYQPLPEYDKNHVDTLCQDLDLLKSEIENYIKIGAMNQEQKLTKQPIIAVNNIVNIYKECLLLLDQTDLQKDLDGEPDLDILKSLLNKTTDPQFDKMVDFKLNKDDQEKVFKAKVRLEEIIHEEFNQLRLSSGELDEDKVSNIFKQYLSPKKLSESTSRISKIENSSIDPLLFLNYVIRNIALDSKKFYKTYQEYLVNNNNISPIVGQEDAVMNAFSMIVDQPTVSVGIQAVKNVVFDIIDDYNAKKAAGATNLGDIPIDFESRLLNKFGILPSSITKVEDLDFYQIAPVYDHMALIEGFAGTGKSKACFENILQILNLAYSDKLNDFAYVHTTEDNANAVLNDFQNHGLDLSQAKGFDKQKFLQAAFGQSYIDHILNQDLSHVDYTQSDSPLIKTASGDFVLNPAFQIENSFQCPKLVFIDEISFWSQPELMLLDKLSKEQGIIFITAGDFSQAGIESSLYNGTTYEGNLAPTNTLFYTTEKLSTVIRSDNNLITEANKTSEENIVKIQSINRPPNSIFKYYENDTSLKGCKFSDNEDDIVNQVQTLIPNLGQDEKIIYIYDNDSSTLKQKLENLNTDKIAFSSLKSAQGTEAKYAIYDLDLTTYNNYLSASDLTLATVAKNIYTAISRAKEGTIIHCKQSDVLNSTYIPTTNERVDSFYKENLTQTMIESQIQKRIDEIKKAGCTELLTQADFKDPNVSITGSNPVNVPNGPTGGPNGHSTPNGPAPSGSNNPNGPTGNPNGPTVPNTPNTPSGPTGPTMPTGPTGNPSGGGSDSSISTTSLTEGVYLIDLIEQMKALEEEKTEPEVESQEEESDSSSEVESQEEPVEETADNSPEEGNIEAEEKPKEPEEKPTKKQIETPSEQQKERLNTIGILRYLKAFLEKIPSSSNINKGIPIKNINPEDKNLINTKKLTNHVKLFYSDSNNISIEKNTFSLSYDTEKKYSAYDLSGQEDALLELATYSDVACVYQIDIPNTSASIVLVGKKINSGEIALMPLEFYLEDRQKNQQLSAEESYFQDLVSIAEVDPSIFIDDENINVIPPTQPSTNSSNINAHFNNTQGNVSFLYPFNTITDIEKDDQGNFHLNQKFVDKRVDLWYGLGNLKSTNAANKKYDRALNQLKTIQSMIIESPDLNETVKSAGDYSVLQYLGNQGYSIPALDADEEYSIQFGFKAQAFNSKNDSEVGGMQDTRFRKESKEKVLDIYSKENEFESFSKHTYVVNIGKYNNITKIFESFLEIPVGSINNPFSLLNYKDSNENNPYGFFQEDLLKWRVAVGLSPDGKSLNDPTLYIDSCFSGSVSSFNTFINNQGQNKNYDIPFISFRNRKTNYFQTINRHINEARQNNMYEALRQYTYVRDLCRIFAENRNFYIPINLADFSGKQEPFSFRDWSLGMQYVGRDIHNTFTQDFLANQDTVKEHLVPLNKAMSRPLRFTADRVTIDGITHEVANGTDFILLSDNPTLKTDEDLIKAYFNKTSNVIKVIISGPAASLDDYITYIKTPQANRQTQIGNIWTSYQILEGLSKLDPDKFKDLGNDYFEEKIKRVYEKHAKNRQNRDNRAFTDYLKMRQNTGESPMSEMMRSISELANKLQEKGKTLNQFLEEKNLELKIPKILYKCPLDSNSKITDGIGVISANKDYEVNINGNNQGLLVHGKVSNTVLGSENISAINNYVVQELQGVAFNAGDWAHPGTLEYALNQQRINFSNSITANTNVITTDPQRTLTLSYKEQLQNKGWIIKTQFIDESILQNLLSLQGAQSYPTKESINFLNEKGYICIQNNVGKNEVVNINSLIRDTKDVKIQQLHSGFVKVSDENSEKLYQITSKNNSIEICEFNKKELNQSVNPVNPKFNKPVLLKEVISEDLTIKNADKLKDILVTDAEGHSLFYVYQRPFILCNVNGTIIPYYISSKGTDGKIKGQWYPFFGFTGNWFIKGDIDANGDMRYCKEIDEVTKLLRENIIIKNAEDLGRLGVVTKTGCNLNNFGFKMYSVYDKYPTLSNYEIENISYTKALKINTSIAASYVTQVTGITALDAKTPHLMSLVTPFINSVKNNKIKSSNSNQQSDDIKIQVQNGRIKLTINGTAYRMLKPDFISTDDPDEIIKHFKENLNLWKQTFKQLYNVTLNTNDSINPTDQVSYFDPDLVNAGDIIQIAGKNMLYKVISKSNQSSTLQALDSNTQIDYKQLSDIIQILTPNCSIINL